MHITDIEVELLAKLAEECGEVVQMVGKTQCHGFDSTHPDGGPTNAELLQRELIDVIVVAGLLMVNGNLEKWADADICQMAKDKVERMRKYAHAIPDELFDAFVADELGE